MPWGNAWDRILIQMRWKSATHGTLCRPEPIDATHGQV